MSVVQMRPPHRANGAAPSEAPLIDIKGESKHTKYISSGFVPALQDLLRRAGFTSGTMTVRFQKFTKGTAHTHGLRLHSPTAFGVQITWHEGSNDNCMLLSIRTPNGMDHTSFHSRLKEAFALDETEQLPEYRQEKVVPPEPEEILPRPVLGNILPTLPPAAAPLSEEVSPVAAAASDVSVSGKNFNDDPDNIELFMWGIAHMVTPSGEIAKDACSLVIKRDFKRAPGPIMHSLISRGHLLKTGDQDLYRVSTVWLKKLQEKRNPASAAAKVERVVVQEVPAGMPAPAQVPTPIAISAPAPVSSLPTTIGGAYAALEEKAGLVARYEEELRVSQEKREVLEEQKRALLAEAQERTARMQDLDTGMAETRRLLGEARQAEKKLLVIRQTLGLE